MLAPSLIYLGIQGVTLLALWLFTTLNQRPFDLHAWDGDWYLAIAKFGYSGVPNSMMDGAGHHTQYTAEAFFPGYPLAAHLASYLTGGNYVPAGIVVSALAGVGLAYGVYRLAQTITCSDRAALIAVALVSAAPMGIVWSMTYPEALTCALIAWALVGTVEHRWWIAGVASCAAGYVSPSVAPLIAIVMVAGFVDIYRARAGWSAAIAVMLAPGGMLAYLTWVQIGAPTSWAFFRIQNAGWDTGLGVDTVKWIGRTFLVDSNAFTTIAAAATVTAVGFTVGAFRRLPWTVWAYAAAMVLLALAKTGTPWALARILLPAFPLAILPALWLSHRNRPAAITLTAALAIAGIWYSAYSLSVWHFSI